MPRDNDARNLLCYLYHYYKLIGIDLSTQTNTSVLQRNNFVGTLEEDEGTKMFSLSQKQQKIF